VFVEFGEKCTYKRRLDSQTYSKICWEYDDSQASIASLDSQAGQAYPGLRIPRSMKRLPLILMPSSSAKHSQVETSTDKYSHMDCVKAKIVVYIDTGQPIQTETKDTIPCEAVVNGGRHDDVPADQGGDQHWGTVGEYNLRDVPWDV
jgi:hypothetical protein